MNHIKAFLLRMLREAALESSRVASNKQLRVTAGRASLHFGRAALNYEAHND